MNKLTDTQLERVISLLKHFSWDLTDSEDADLKNEIQLIINTLTRTS